MPVFQVPTQTQSSGTVIVDIIPPVANMIPRVTAISYTCAATAHTLRLMRCVGTTTITDQAASGQAVINVADISPMIVPTTGAEESIAASDYVAYANTNGVFEVRSVSSVSSLAVTLAANLGDTVESGTTLYVFGELARADHVSMSLAASVVNTHAGLRMQGGTPAQSAAYTAGRTGAGDPALIISDNSTNAGTLHYAAGEYVASSDVAMV